MIELIVFGVTGIVATIAATAEVLAMEATKRAAIYAGAAAVSVLGSVAMAAYTVRKYEIEW